MKQQNLLFFKRKSELCCIRFKRLYRLLSIIICICIWMGAMSYAGNIVNSGMDLLGLHSSNMQNSNMQMPNPQEPMVGVTSESQEDVSQEQASEESGAVDTVTENVETDGTENAESEDAGTENTGAQEPGTEESATEDIGANNTEETGAEDTGVNDTEGSTAEDAGENGAEENGIENSEPENGGEDVEIGEGEASGTQDLGTENGGTAGTEDTGTESDKNVGTEDTGTDGMEDIGTEDNGTVSDVNNATNDESFVIDETPGDEELSVDEETPIEKEDSMNGETASVEDVVTDEEASTQEETLTDEEEKDAEKRIKLLSNRLASVLETVELEPLAAAGTINLGQYNNGGTIKLTSDVTASGQCNLSGSAVLDIDLNGYTMTVSGNQAFMLNGGTPVLNIRDTSVAGTGKIIAKGQLVYGCNGGTFNLYSGTIDGSQASKAQMGGCVWLGASMKTDNVFNMYGGTITGFQATEGGAVYVSYPMSGYSYFYMYGGTIENCNATNGAAVYTSSSGGKVGYCYIKGGKSPDGEPKATINCVTYNGQPVSNAIFNYGYLGMEGVVDIDGIVFLNQNNWADTNNRFIRITGRLVVVGDGYIDVNTSYPNSNAICPGHTVVQNSTRTEDTDPSNDISPEEFYTYGSYFINTTKGLLISAGFDPTKQAMANGDNYPANWPSYQADKYSSKYSYVDVMGQTLLIQASDSPGDKRKMQNYDYLIYTERADASQDYAEFYSIKISKRDINTNAPLDGANFSLKKQVVAGDGSITYEELGDSGTTGDYSDGVSSGETYIYLGDERDGKLMIADGTYVLVEDVAPPGGYIARGELATIEIKHEKDESTGQIVSVVRVIANDKVLTTTEQVINSSYGDTGYLVNKELVLYLKNSTVEIQENIDYKIRMEKYQDETYQTPLAGAEFALYTTAEPITMVATGTTDENGVLQLYDLNGSPFTFSNGESYSLQETRAPDEYYLMDDVLNIAVNEDNQVLIDNIVLGDEQTITMEQSAMTNGAATATHGSWTVTLAEDLLTFKVYDEPMPPYWNLQARKYGTQVLESLAMAGAKFTLYKVEEENGSPVEKEVISVTSSDGTDGSPIGYLSFKDNEGNLLRLECDTTYILRETLAPQGYTLTEDIIFQVNEDGTVIDIKQNEEAYSNASYDAENKIVTLSITNDAVFHMPETGGIGIYPLVKIGIAMMCISAVMLMLLLYNRKKQY